MILKRSDAAIADVDEIWSFVARDSERAADRLIERIDGAFPRLTDFPRMGVERPDLAAEIRAVRVDNYVIFYRLEADAVSIERVLHARRDATGARSSVPIPKFAGACGNVGRTSESIRTLASVSF